MKKLYGVGRMIIIFIPSAYLAAFVYPEFFQEEDKRVIYSLIWSLPTLHLLWCGVQLMTMVTGRKYQKLQGFLIVRTGPFSIGKVVFKQIGLKRLFLQGKIDGKEKIVRGLFLRPPQGVWVYKNTHDKWQTLTWGHFLTIIAAIFFNIAAAGLLRIAFSIAAH